MYTVHVVDERKGGGREGRREGIYYSHLLCVQVVKQCCMTDGVEPHYIKEEILPHFFRHFWNQRMALDRRNFRQVWGRQSTWYNTVLDFHCSYSILIMSLSSARGHYSGDC